MILSALSSLVLAFHPQVARAPTPEDPPGAFGYDLRLLPGEVLLDYRWDRGDPVPFLAPATPLRLPFGERGVDPSTRLYLPASSQLETNLTGASVSERRSVGRVPGIFGEALSFDPGTLLRIALAPASPQQEGWTLSLWVQPKLGALGRTIVLLPGALELSLGVDRKVRARLLPSGPEVVHPVALRLGDWSFLAACYDPAQTRQLRLVVGQEAVNVDFPAPGPSRSADEVLVGDVGSTGRGFEGAIDELLLEGSPLSSDAAMRVARHGPPSGTHRLELHTTLGMREAFPVADPLRTVLLDTPTELEQGDLDGVVVQNGQLTWAPARWRRVETRTTPPPRTTHPTVAIGGGEVFTFGGETRDTHLGPMSNTSDTWIFERATRRWERVLSPTSPSPRCHVPAAYSPDHDLVLLAGGWKNDVSPTESYADTWVFHVRSRRWEQRFPAGPALLRGSDYGLVYLPALRRFLLLHGVRNWLYDPVGDAWELLPPVAAFATDGTPLPFTFGGSAMCGVDPETGLVLVFGGHQPPNATVFTDRTALYDVTTNTYTVLDPPVRPSARVRSGFAYDSARKVFVLFGGVQDQYSPRHDDLWTFDPRTRLWTELACSGRPAERGGLFGMAYDEDADDFVMFSGRESPELWLDDTQVLRLRQDPGTALYTLDRLGWSGRHDWFADVSAPGDSRVRFLFRTGDSGADWGPWLGVLPRNAGARFLQVAAVLEPGSHGEVPSIRRMGLR